ncbi:MAG: O-antigen ligase family protein [Candidatus Komeilibacteria bacterium]
MLTPILIFIFYLCFSVFIWKDLLRGIYLITLLLPTYLIRFEIFNIPLTLLEGMIWILFLFWLIKLYLDKELNLTISAWLKSKFTKSEREQGSMHNIVPHKLRWPVLAILATTTIALCWSPNLQAAAGIWKAFFIEPILFFMVMIYHVRKYNHIQKIINALAILSIIIFVYAVIQKLTGWNITNLDWYLPETRRITTFFGYPNANGLFLAPLAALFFASLWFKEHFLFKILKFIAFLGSVLTIIWAGSEGALFALAAAVFIILLLKKQTRILAGAIMVLTIVIVVANPSIKTTLWQKITISDFSGQIRQAQWTETITMLGDQPIKGGGLANYQRAIEPYHQRGITINDQWQPVEIFLYPHNLVLNFWTELGLLGLITIIWLFVIIGLLLYQISMINKKLPKYKQKFVGNLNLGILGFFSVIIIHGLVDVPYFKNDLSLVFWLIIGILVVLYNHNLNKEIMKED